MTGKPFEGQMCPKCGVVINFENYSEYVRLFKFYKSEWICNACFDKNSCDKCKQPLP